VVPEPRDHDGIDGGVIARERLGERQCGALRRGARRVGRELREQRVVEARSLLRRLARLLSAVTAVELRDAQP
jgi:hypothetical protein